MPCACCETGRCCNGATCTAGTKSQCAFGSGTFTAGGNCTQYACTAPYGPSVSPQCTLADGCQCSAAGKILRNPTTTCNCVTLTSAGVLNGGCPSYYCNACDTGTGFCVNTCASPRVCCAGTCCPLSQRCDNASGNCVNKCTTGTFCAGTGSAYACCTAGQKCCGPSGCLSYSTTNLSINVAVNDWVNTGVNVTAGIVVGASGTVQWAGAGSTATPNGVTSGACNCCDGASVSAAFCHMALIGRIGTTGTPFLVGSSYSGSPGAGLLYLRQNDTVVGDNSGSYSVTILTDPCPGYTPAAIGEPIVYAAGEEPPKSLPGPGAALKSLLRLAGIVASPTCSCNDRAAQMDVWGEWECLKRLPEITGWLKEEAEKRELWFFPPAGVALILAAISLSALKRPFRGTDR